MKKIILIIGLILSMLVMPGCSTKIDGERLLSNDEWIEDIEYLDNELKSKHPDLFRYISEDTWNENVQKLKLDVPKLSDTSISLRIAQLVSSINDGHTNIDTLNLLTPIGEETIEVEEVFLFPVGFEYFDDGLRVVVCDKEYKEILGCKLVAINSIEVDEIINRLSTLTYYDNSQFAKERVKRYISVYEYLKFLNIVDNYEAEYLFENDNKERKSIEMKALKNKDIDYIEVDKKLSKINEIVREKNKFYWYELLEEDNILYFKFDRIFTKQQPNFGESGEEYPNYYEFHKELMEEINNRNFQKLVIDLRDNPGGAISLVEFITHELRYKANLDKDDIFVITGKTTASAAADLAWQLQYKIGATIIGEETGGNVNYFCTEGATINLPNSKLSIRIPFAEINNYYGHEGGVKPDVEIIQSFESYINGIDDCYEYINNQID